MISDLVAREASLRGQLTSTLIDLSIVSAELTPDIWPATDLPPIAKAVGWSIYRPVLTHPSGMGSVETPERTLVYCPPVFVSASSWCSNLQYRHYLRAVLRLIELLDAAGSEDRRWEAEMRLLDEDEVGFKTMNDVEWRAVNGN